MVPGIGAVPHCALHRREILAVWVQPLRARRREHHAQVVSLVRDLRRWLCATRPSPRRVSRRVLASPRLRTRAPPPRRRGLSRLGRRATRALPRVVGPQRLLAEARRPPWGASASRAALAATEASSVPYSRSFALLVECAAAQALGVSAAHRLRLTYAVGAFCLVRPQREESRRHRRRTGAERIRFHRTRGVSTLPSPSAALRRARLHRWSCGQRRLPLL
mmetsp:Transcript_16821/g.52229  ORF Transcript_16821/g.52229 Transcript_16821/m.52229 type:complete len:220 (-) Transcript_16821:1013-1672(-)